MYIVFEMGMFYASFSLKDEEREGRKNIPELVSLSFSIPFRLLSVEVTGVYYYYSLSLSLYSFSLYYNVRF